MMTTGFCRPLPRFSDFLNSLLCSDRPKMLVSDVQGTRLNNHYLSGVFTDSSGKSYSLCLLSLIVFELF